MFFKDCNVSNLRQFLIKASEAYFFFLVLQLKKNLQRKNAIKFFWSGQIFRVGRGRGNKCNFIFGLIGQLELSGKIFGDTCCHYASVFLTANKHGGNLSQK